MSAAEASSTLELEKTVTEADSLREAVMRSMDAAAVCWDDPTKAGEFHDSCAANVGESLLAYLKEHYGIQ